MTGEIWKRLQTAVGDDSVTANTIRQFFRAVVRRKLGAEASLTALEEADASKEAGRRPRFGNLTMATQKVLKEMVRNQYTSLPKGQEVELLIEEAFNLLFKGKHQYPGSKAKRSKLKFLSVLLSNTHSFLESNDNETSEPETNSSNTCKHSTNSRLSTTNIYPQAPVSGGLSIPQMLNEI